MGVTLMKNEDKQRVVAIAKIDCSDDIDDK
jgi:hypothetical protein